MTWCHLPTGFSARLALRTAGLLVLCVALTTTLFPANDSHATAGINQTVNFQGRLLDATGGVVPDGYYNIQFKIYQDGDGLSAGDTTGSPSGSLKWTETYINNNVSTGAVLVKNGYLSVNLGSKTAFGGSVDWNQDTIWLSMNVAGSAVACTTFGTAPCAADGEMLPMKRMTATPYSLNSGALNGLTSSNFVQLAQGVQTDASAVPSVFINKTNATGNLLELQNTATDVFTVANNGDLTLGSTANHTVSVAASGAGVAGKNLTISAGASGTGAVSGGDIIIQGGVSGGSGVQGQVKLSTGGYSTATNQSFAANGSVTQANVDNYSSIDISSSVVGPVTITVPAPTTKYSGRVLYVQITGSNAIALAPNGGTTVSMNQNTAVVLVWNTATNGWLNASTDNGNNNYIQNQTAVTQTAAFKINGVGTAASFVGASLDVASAGTLSLGTATSNAVTIGHATTASTITIGGTGANTIALGNTQTGGSIGIGSALTSGSVAIGGTAAGTSTVSLQGGTSGSAISIQSGAAGTIAIGTANVANTVTVGNTANAVAQTVNLGYNNTASSTTNVNVGNLLSTSATLIQGGTGATAVGIQSGAGGTISVGTTNVANTVTVGNTANAVAQTVNLGYNNTASSTTNVNIGNLLSTSATTIQGGTGATAVNINSGAAGTINVGTANTANTIQIGSTTLSAGTQTINIGNNNTAGGTTNVTIGTGTTATGGSTAIQSKANTTISTNGVARATFDTSGNLYLGNGVTSAVTSFIVQGSGGTAGVAGSTLSVQGGIGGSASAGGALTIAGGSGGSGTTNASIGGNLTIQGGNGGGTNGSAGNLTLDTGTVTGTGVKAALSVGTANAASISIGNTSATFTAESNATANLFTGNTAHTVQIATNSGSIQTLTLGSTNVGSVTTIQGGGGITLTGAVSGSSTINAVTGFKFNGTAGLTQTCGSGNYMQQEVVQGGIVTSGTCTSLASTTTLQNAYDNSTSPALITETSGKGTAIRDFTSTVGNIFAVQNNAGSTNYLAVTSSGASVAGTFSATGTINNATISGGTLSGGTYSATGATFGAASSTVGLTAAGVGTAGGNLTLQGGQSGTGAVNGGDVVIQGGATGGTGVQGQVKLSTGGYTTATAQNFAASGNVTQANVDNFSSIEITSTGAGGPWTATIPAPTTKYNGRLLYVQISTIAGGPTSINVQPNGGTLIAMNAGSAVTLVWNTTVNAGAGGWLNAGADGGSNSYIQNQNSSTQTANFKINGTGTANTFVVAAGQGLDVASAGTLNLGTGTATTVQVGSNSTAVAQTFNIGFNATAGSTANVNIGDLLSSSSTLIQGGTSATAVAIQSGAAGTISIGSANAANTIQIGSTILSAGTQTITVGGANTAGGTQNVIIGSNSSAAAGTTTIQSKGDTLFTTNGTSRALLSGSGNTLYVGNANTSGQAATANAFTIQGTSSTGASTQGGALTIQSGAATSGSANGGNLNLTAGAGVGSGATGLVVLNTPTFQTASSQSCGINCNITQANIDGNGAVIINATAASLTATLSDPTITTAGRVVYVTAANGSNDFTLAVNGGGSGNQIAMRQNTTATMIWNGADWTAAGASSSTTLQAAYDNTLTSAGGAELLVSNGTNANGLTIRDSAANPVNGTLLEVQNSAAATTFAVNGTVTEYASNAGVETAISASDWSAAPVAATVTRNVTTGFVATGQGSASVLTSTTALSGVKNQLSTTLTANQHYNVSFAAKLASGTFTDMEVYYSNQGTNSSVKCIDTQAIKTSVWTKVNCAFTASASGITSSNAIIIRQTGSGTAHTFYVDNLSVTIAADYNYATDGTVNDNTNFGTNWTTAGLGTVGVTRITSDGQEASDSAQAAVTVGAANAGVRNKLSINPLTSTLYRVSVYAKLMSGAAFTDFKVRYSRDAGTNFVDCVDYNTQTVVTTGWTQITCYIQTDGTTPSGSGPYVYFDETSSGVRTYAVDAFSMTLSGNTTPNVQIGGGILGGPTTLFTVDKGASAPIAANNDALLGSMYYDTTLGKLQCYEADGWGACGCSPDNIVTISPEYTNAVMHGTGVGTMTSDLCSGSLGINDGTSSQPTICASGETYNFYKWTSPQATAQAYSIYVTYQLPGTFKAFTSGSTSLMGRTDSTNSSVVYQVYRSSGGLTTCGSSVSVSTGVQASWQTKVASGAADPSTCGFGPGDSIVFKITASSNSNANAYIGNLGFTFSNK